MDFKQFVVASLVGVFVLLGILCLSNLGGRREDSDVFKGPFVPVRAEELLLMYRFKDKEADKRFTDKGVEVDGQVLKLEKPSVILLVAGGEGQIQCYFPPKEWAKVEDKLQYGDAVTIRGQCRGLDKRVSTPTVAMRGCSLAEPPEIPHP